MSKGDAVGNLVGLIAGWITALGLLIWLSVLYSRESGKVYISINATVDFATSRGSSAYFNVSFVTPKNYTVKAYIRVSYKYSSSARAVVDAYPPGSKRLVYYDQADPKRAFFTKPSGGIIGGLIVCAIFVGLPVVIAVVILAVVAIKKCAESIDFSSRHRGIDLHARSTPSTSYPSSSAMEAAAMEGGRRTDNPLYCRDPDLPPLYTEDDVAETNNVEANVDGVPPEFNRGSAPASEPISDSTSSSGGGVPEDQAGIEEEEPKAATAAGTEKETEVKKVTIGTRRQSEPVAAPQPPVPVEEAAPATTAAAVPAATTVEIEAETEAAAAAPAAEPVSREVKFPEPEWQDDTAPAWAPSWGRPVPQTVVAPEPEPPKKKGFVDSLFHNPFK